MRTSWLRALALGCTSLLLVGFAGCSDDAPPGSEETGDDIVGFDRNRIATDEAFTNANALSETEIERLLANTPWNTRSPLAGREVRGVPMARAIHESALKYNLSPLVFLTRAQMEKSLLTKTPRNDDTIDFAFGCGCYDGKACKEEFRGFDRQMDCLGTTMRKHLDRLATGKPTVSGWALGVAKDTLDPLTVTPATNATAALYTYTPWVGVAGGGREGIGGNSLHYALWTKLSKLVKTSDAGAGDAGSTDAMRDATSEEAGDPDASSL